MDSMVLSKMMTREVSVPLNRLEVARIVLLAARNDARVRKSTRREWWFTLRAWRHSLARLFGKQAGAHQHGEPSSYLSGASNYSDRPNGILQSMLIPCRENRVQYYNLLV